MEMTYSSLAAAIAAFALTFGAQAQAGPVPVPSTLLTLKDHRFVPATLIIPKGTRVRIILVNQDAATEEFDSHDLRIEQLVTPHAKASFAIGPLKPGTYTFMGEFHPDTASGQILVKER
jgi:heme/copper-type cytochrome/quinol oxidase subunit 2